MMRWGFLRIHSANPGLRTRASSDAAVMSPAAYCAAVCFALYFAVHGVQDRGDGIKDAELKIEQLKKQKDGSVVLAPFETERGA